jgi:receptor expression-enhancing protein 5/6
LAYGVIALGSLYLIVGAHAEFLAGVLSLAYPLAATYQALRNVNSDPKEKDLLLSFWTTYGGLAILEFWKQEIHNRFLVYWFLKTLGLLYLYAPQTRGALVLKDRLLLPAANKLQQIANYYATRQNA